MWSVRRVEDGILEKLTFIRQKGKTPTALDLKGIVSEMRELGETAS